MIKPETFINLPVSYKGKFKIYPPTINDVIGNPNYAQYKKLLTFSQEEIEDEFNERMKEDSSFVPPTPIEFLLATSYNNKTIEILAKKAFMLFLKEEVHFLYEQKVILVGDLESSIKNANSVDDLILITEDDFFDIQNLIREAIGDKPVERPNPNEHPKIRRMKALARYRDKIKAKQGSGISLTTSLAAICCMGIGITPLNIGEMSYAALPIMLTMCQKKDRYETDIRSLQAGADSKKIKPKYWIEDID